MTNREYAASVERADERIRNGILRTPLEFAPGLSRAAEARVFIKWECDQQTGSFKLRGALNALRSLTAAERGRGVLSASTGNHGLAMLHAAGLEKIRLTLFVPLTIAAVKRDKLRAAGADLVIAGATCEQSEIMARAEAARSGRVYVSPYNDARVVAGQGTVGLEIGAALPDLGDVLVPVGGGGLAAGIGAALAARLPMVRVWGVEPAHSAFMAASLTAGRLVEIAEKPTLADAVAGGIEPGSITFDLCRRCLSGIITVSERTLRAARLCMERLHGRPVEGAGALALAGLRTRLDVFRGRTVVLVVSGRNAPPAAAGLPRRSVSNKMKQD
ncbi:MAG: pyridoxal-phosphate dependent enzyme [Candidatus Aminicenantes bacterium]|nr:pyridoxal-phosphate dependent enzyme [Candidatus Aminicenantes bacterium]